MFVGPSMELGSYHPSGAKNFEVAFGSSSP